MRMFPDSTSTTWEDALGLTFLILFVGTILAILFDKFGWVAVLIGAALTLVPVGLWLLLVMILYRYRGE